MTEELQTLEDRETRRRRARREPGLVLVHSGGKPQCRAIPLATGAVRLGRETEAGPRIDDPRMSREHAEISFRDGQWHVEDLGSRNGTFVDGQRVARSVDCSHAPVVRMGRSVLLGVQDIWRYLSLASLVDADRVAGPSLRSIFAEIELLAASGADLLIAGESGSGKELAAEAFHRASAYANGPFISVNCATIPEGIAERLLFGVVKGAYSGAEGNADGYLQAAQHGVLFLDEFGELSLEVQAKLLRVVETKEILPLGATKSRRVELRFCLATHRDLRAAVVDGRFRADLLYRVRQTSVELPPLRARREEIPWLARLQLERAGDERPLSAEFIESCLLRPWPGNVRELLGTVARASRAARAENADALEREHLDAEAGCPLERHAAPAPRKAPLTRQQVETALREQPNASKAARQLGVHRSHFYRLLKQFGL
jgi:transcriptional regulator of acetoin/glycerol metabolism